MDLTFVPIKYRVTEEISIDVRDDRGPEANWTWAIVRGESIVLTRENDWEWEPSPSSRTDDFKTRSRFSLEEAKQHIERYLRGKPYGQVDC